MKRLVLIALPLLIATPSLAADLDGPRYSEREYFERRQVEREAPPRFIEREVSPPKVVEHHHYHHNVQPRVYTEERILPPPRVYTEERIYRAPRVYGFYDKPFHRYEAWRPRHHFWHRPWRHRHARAW